MTTLRMPMIYVAHEFGGDKANLKKARASLHELTRRFPGVLWVAPWIDWATALHSDREDQRERGLAMDMQFVDRCDAVLVTGPRISDGCRQECERKGEWAWLDVEQHPRVLRDGLTDGDAFGGRDIVAWVATVVGLANPGASADEILSAMREWGTV